jgi:tetratricopeptide (TPR) repeat protein
MDTPATVFAQATQAYAEGSLDLAEQHFRSVVGGEPNHAEALRFLGLIAHQQGNAGRAIDYLNTSLIADGTNADTWRQLGDAHLAVGYIHDAIANYEQALRLRPERGEAYNNLGVAWLYLGELDKGIECLRAAIDLTPPSALTYNNLGFALKKQGNLAEAIAAFEQAVRLRPDHAEYTGNLAVTFHENGELDQAVAAYRETLRLEPNNARASNNLGAILKEQGLVDDATAQFLSSLRIDPDHALAFYNLCELAIEGTYEFPPSELDRIKAFMESERCSAADRSLCCFGLAMLFNQQGSHDEAFRYYTQANDLRKQLNREQNNVFDARGHDALVDRIIAAHDQAYFARIQGWGLETEQPVFIVGMPRSGSTLVEQILASHPQVFGAGEINEIPRLVSQLTSETGGELYAGAFVPDAHVARKLAADCLQRVTAHAANHARVTLKTLENYLHLGLIATLFPRARIIHCRRDPLDACLSCYFQNFYNVVFSWSLEDIGACYRAYEKLMAHWSSVLPLRCHEICYEELVHDQEAVTRKLLAFCGLDWNESCLAFFNTRRVVRTASLLQVRKPISAKMIGRWKHYRAHLEPLFRALGRWSETPASDSTWKRPEHSAPQSRG